MGRDGAGHPLRRGTERVGGGFPRLPARDRSRTPELDGAKAGYVVKRRAVFLDRDGVLVRAAPLVDYAHGPHTLDEFSMFEGIAEPVQRLRDAGFLTVLATNQPAIARGDMDWKTLDEMHRRLAAKVPLDDIEVCPHVDADDCPCRKPK